MNDMIAIETSIILMGERNLCSSFFFSLILLTSHSTSFLLQQAASAMIKVVRIDAAEKGNI